MTVTSCGIIPYHVDENGMFYFLVGHPGGNFTKHKDIWTLFKGQKEGGEDDVACALREFEEETGIHLTKSTKLIDLGTIKQNATKEVHAFAYKTKMFDTKNLRSNIVPTYNWPEIDRYEWKTYDELKDKVHKTHVKFYHDIVLKTINNK